MELLYGEPKPVEKIFLYPVSYTKHQKMLEMRLLFRGGISEQITSNFIPDKRSNFGKALSDVFSTPYQIVLDPNHAEDAGAFLEKTRFGAYISTICADESPSGKFPVYRLDIERLRLHLSVQNIEPLKAYEKTFDPELLYRPLFLSKYGRLREVTGIHLIPSAGRILGILFTGSFGSCVATIPVCDRDDVFTEPYLTVIANADIKHFLEKYGFAESTGTAIYGSDDGFASTGIIMKLNIDRMRRYMSEEDERILEKHESVFKKENA